MKEHLRQLVASVDNHLAQQCLAREYLQARILESLQDQGAFQRWAFLGGTALRFLFSIPRFSEDLDFSLITPRSDAAFGPALAKVKRSLEIEGYRIEVRVSDQKPVASASIKFRGLPYELGLSPRQSETLTIKIEVDTNPPAGAHVETSLVRRHVTLNLCHHDKSTLLAGKLHAVFSRKWAKGRDLYDLAWYLADRDWPTPNLELLNSALLQTSWTGPRMTVSNWRDELRRRLDALDWKRAQADVAPFLERERDIALVNKETLYSLLESRSR
jgi:predicted nucleotidyltransferase component of viral defense system